MPERSHTLPTHPAPGAGQSFADFRHTVSHAVVALDVHAAEPDRFRGHLEAGMTGDIHIFDVRADAHSVHRTSSLIDRAPQHYLKFSVIEQGSGLIVQEGRETVLSAGDMALYDTDLPYSLVFDDAVRMSIVMFPRELIGIPRDRLAGMTAVRLGGPTGVGQMIRPFLSSLSRQLVDVDRHIARRLFRTAFDMVGTLLESELGERQSPDPHQALVERVLDYIDEHLGEPDLDPGRIAAAHFISVRHLHALFSDRGTTVSTVIRTHRLDRCYDDLIHPRHAERSVTAIALDNGFVDAAHFSRTFRAHFGVPPSAVRQGRA